MEHSHHHLKEHHAKEVTQRSVKYLMLSFVINICLSVVEIIGGIIAGSISLIADALHNTSDAFSILIAVLAFRIGQKKATDKYTYGFKRAEVIGAFTNLVLLFISGLYLFAEGVERLFSPHPIDGWMIIVISLFALVVDAATAKISHTHAHHNANMKMLFLHNLADAFGSAGVILSGLCVVLFDIWFVDGIIALMIASYMLIQAVVSFGPVVRILMNGAPENINVSDIIDEVMKINGVQDIHHIHVWCISEHDVSLECHIKGDDLGVIRKVKDTLSEKFHIEHSTIQLEDASCEHCKNCGL